MSQNRHKTTINKKPCVIKFVTAKTLKKHGKNLVEDDDEVAGLCYNPDGNNPQILIDKDIKGFEQLRVSLHEGYHFVDFKKSEDYVDKVSTSLAQMIWELGYRKIKNI